jgi:hypothetical protein
MGYRSFAARVERHQSAPPVPKINRFKIPGVKNRKGKPMGAQPVSSCSIDEWTPAVGDTEVETRGRFVDVPPGDVVRSLMGARVIRPGDGLGVG